MAYEGGFIHFLSTYPDLCDVAGDVEMVKELNNVIQLRDENLLLSYDTTFNLGEFYVSPLVFKHVVFEANALVASLFLNKYYILLKHLCNIYCDVMVKRQFSNKRVSYMPLFCLKHRRLELVRTV